MSGAGSYKTEPGYKYHRDTSYLQYTKHDFIGKDDVKAELEFALKSVEDAHLCCQDVYNEEMNALDAEYMPKITRNEKVIQVTTEACDAIEKDPAVLKMNRAKQNIQQYVDMMSTGLDEAKAGGLSEEKLKEYWNFLKGEFLLACQEFDPYASIQV